MWFVYAITFALTSSLGTILAKKVMRNVDEKMFLMVSSFFSLPLLFLLILIFYQIPKVDTIFIVSLLVSTMIGVAAALLAYKAIRESEISLISPISAFNPVFTSVISFIVLREAVGTKGVAGILLIVFGAYLLQISKFKEGIFKPIQSLLTHKGVQLSLGAYFIWSITPVFEKTAIYHTNPSVPPFASLIGGLMAIPVYAFLVRKDIKKVFRGVKNNFKYFLLIGFLGAIGQAVAFTAFSLTNLGYATAVFKLSMIFTVIFGWLFFKEQNIKERLLGSLVMLLGVILLVT
jgi:uncharacterized membrane protein